MDNVGVRHHLNRFGMVSTDCCSCGAVETIDHFLLSCTNYSLSRRKLRNASETINVECPMRWRLSPREANLYLEMCSGVSV